MAPERMITVMFNDRWYQKADVGEWRMIDAMRRRQDYRRAFGGEPGRRVLRDLMRRHFVLRSTQIAGDSHETAFNEGRRAVVLDILHALRADEDSARRLATESMSDE